MASRLALAPIINYKWFSLAEEKETLKIPSHDVSQGRVYLLEDRVFA